jgi:hypothetical protein
VFKKLFIIKILHVQKSIIFYHFLLLAAGSPLFPTTAATLFIYLWLWEQFQWPWNGIYYTVLAMEGGEGGRTIMSVL